MQLPKRAPLKVAVVGGGWAGLAAAVKATQAAHHVTVFEASRQWGGRARSLPATLPDGSSVTLDNGQHILIGAYTETLQLMRQVGVDPAQVLLNLPMTLQFADGSGIRFGSGPTPLDAAAGILGARGWSWSDKAALLRAALRWRWQRFTCDATLSVADLCQTLPARVRADLIEPLCVSALNTPIQHAGAAVFLRVLHDALFGVRGGSRLLLPRVDLGALLPQAAVKWLSQHGSTLHLAHRVTALVPDGAAWRVDGQPFDAVVLAGSAENMALALMESAHTAPPLIASRMTTWATCARHLRFEAITTVYAWSPKAHLTQPMLALRSAPGQPAQFVFDRGQLGGLAGLLAFVVSASQADRATLQAQVLAQARNQLGLDLQAVQAVVEKRATFACTPGLTRPGAVIAPGLVACGDYVAGPYPATLEGAVRSAHSACALLPI